MQRFGDAGSHKAAPEYKNTAYKMPERVLKFHNAQIKKRNKQCYLKNPQKEECYLIAYLASKRLLSYSAQ